MPDKKLLLTKEEEKAVLEAFRQGATNNEASLETGVDFKKLCRWRSLPGNNEQVERIIQQPIWIAKKIFHNPTNHKEAEAVLKRHPLSKADYSDRIEHKTEVSLKDMSDDDLRERAAELIGKVIS